jgi:hypothetical protein
MNLPKYEINYTGTIPENSTGIVFNPKEIQIAIGSRFIRESDGVEFVKICITLTETISEDWYNQQVRTIAVPVAFLNCIDGFDTVQMKPSINLEVLGTILSQWHINLV